MQEPWEINFTLARSPGVPLYLQVAGSVLDRLEKGLLAPGAPLPGTRSLAKSLGVHRNTVKAAYDELVAGGWVSTAPSRGTFIAAGTSRPGGGRQSGAARISIGTVADSEIVGCAPPPLPYRRTVVCTDGLPDPRLAPAAELARAIRRALRSPKTWGANDPRGNADLRAAIAEMLRTSRSIPAAPGEIIVSGGRRMSLFLVAQALLSEGSAVAVEQPGNKAAWEVFEQCGLRVVGVPVDGEGLRTDFLENCAGVSALYVTPARQYPTAVSMSPERREHLLSWSRKTSALIIEDDYDSEYQFEGAPMLPLAAMDAQASIAHIGSISRMFAPAVHSGYIRACNSAAARIARLRNTTGCDGDRIVEAALFELATDGVLRRHNRRVRSIYRERRDQLALALRQEFGNRLKFALPGGGLGMWVEPPAEIDTRAWAESGRRRGLRFAPSMEYRLDRLPHGGVRIGFAAFSNEELVTVAAALKRSLPESDVPIPPAIQEEGSQFRRCTA